MMKVDDPKLRDTGDEAMKRMIRAAHDVINKGEFRWHDFGTYNEMVWSVYNALVDEHEATKESYETLKSNSRTR